MQARAERHRRRREGRTEHEEEELDIFHRECECYLPDQRLSDIHTWRKTFDRLFDGEY